MTNPASTNRQSLSRTSDLALIAPFAALIAVCAILPHRRVPQLLRG